MNQATRYASQYIWCWSKEKINWEGLVTKFHQNQLTLKGRSAGQRHTDRHRQAGGFYVPIAPPVPNAPSSECSRASIAARHRAAGSIRISRPASCCCSSAIAGIAIGPNFKIYLLRQFCSNRVEFFFTIHRRHRCKKWWTRILKFDFVIFENFFKIFKKVSSGPFAADLDHYGRGQTRSE